MADISREDRDLHAVMRNLYRLPYRQQLRALQNLLTYLDGGVGIETKLSKELRERMEALEQVEKAVAWLKLAPGQAPTIESYTDTIAPAGLTMTANDVIRAFGGRWKNAQKAVTGGRVPETPTQRALRRATSGRERKTETYLHGVAIWADTPGLASETKDDYDAFVDVYNDRPRKGELPLVRSDSVTCAFPLLTWEEILAGARGQLDVSELMLQRGQERLREAEQKDGLLGAADVAALLGVRPHESSILVRQGQLPPPIAYLGKTPVWLADDIRAHLAGQPTPDRSNHPLAQELMGTADLSVMLGMTSGSILAALCARRPTVPRPDGRVSGKHYWLGPNVREWQRRRRVWQRRRQVCHST